MAFGGVLPASTILSLILTQALLKTAYEIVVLPVTLAVVSRLRRIEGGDAVDTPETDYRPWRVADV